MDGMYAISEMAKLFGLSRQTLIYYDRIGLFKPARVNDEGYRLYAPTQIPKLRLICLLRDMGLELKEIERAIASPDPGPIADCLSEQVSELDAQISELQAKRSYVLERLQFYRDALLWKERLGRPMLKHYDERFVVFEPFPAGQDIDRRVLHPTLMHALSRLKAESGAAPVRGWGTMLCREAIEAGEPLAGSGPFVTVPEGVDPVRLTGVQMLPEGIYLCMSRWGMPYDTRGIDRAVCYMREHGLHAAGNAFDFCLLDTTSYDERHQEDLCCIQIPVEL